MSPPTLAIGEHVSHAQTEQRVIIRFVSWTTYEHLLADLAHQSSTRLTYDRGLLEIMYPLPEHEEWNRTIALLVEVLAEEGALTSETSVQPRYGADMRCSTYLFRCYSHPQYSGLSESAPATNKGDITGVASTKWRMEVSGGSLYLTAAGQALKSCVFPPLADTILDQRLQNAYKMPLRGDALRTRGATKTPGARTAG